MKQSLDEVFFVLVHVALQDVFNGAQQSLECVSFDRHYSAVTLSFHACLPHCILHQSDFSEIVAVFVLEDFLGCSQGGVLLLSDEFALSNDVEPVSLVALVDDV